MIRVLVVDDNPIIRQGVRALLEGSTDDIDVVGEAATGREAIQRAGELSPDVVLLDIRMPIMNGVEAAAALSPRHKVLMLTYSDEEPLVVGAIRAGALGYLVHGRFEAEELERAVRAVADGRTSLSPAVAPVVFEALKRESTETAVEPHPESGPDALTEREREVMNLIARGRANKVIAAELFISEKTVKNHIRHIYEKLGAAHRSEATALWLGLERRGEP